MKAVQTRSLIVRYMLTMVLCAATGGRLAAQEAVAPVAGIAGEAAPAAIPPPAPVPVEAEAAPPAAPAPVPVEVEAAPPAAPAPVPVEVEAAPAVEAPAVVQPANGNELPEGRTNESGRITISLDNIELADVVQLFTRLSGANIICNTTNLKGSVTANLEDVEWEPAFRAILERQGLLLQEDPKNKGIFSIEPKKPDAPEPWVTETFKLSYLKAGDAADMLTSMLGLADPAEKSRPVAKPVASSKKDDDEPVKEDVAVVVRKEGRVVSYPAGNMVVVSTTAPKMEEIRAVLASVDLPRQQVYIEAKILELSGDKGKKTGLDWSMLGRMNVAQLSGYRDYQYDRLHTESDVIDTSKTITRNSSTHDSTRQYTDHNGRSISDDRVWTSLLGLRDLQVFLSALETSGDVTTISNPKVIVANEERAVIDMTTKTPYIVVARTAGTEESPGDKYSSAIAVIPGDNEDLPYIEQAFFSSGLKLDVTPRINNASNITIKVVPTISFSKPYLQLLDDGGFLNTGYPEISLKSARTVFSMDNGQTAVIGGLTQTRDRDMVKKVPLLGDIPLVGKYLFSHTEKAKEQVETIIFVTVGIVDSEKRQMALAVPEGASLVQKHVDAEGRLIKWASPAEMDPEKAELVPEVVED